MPGPLSIKADDVRKEGWDDARGKIDFRTLLSADRTASDTFTCGISYLAPGGNLAPHRHEPPEIYFGIEGRALVKIDGQEHEIAPGTVIYIPGNAVHSVQAGSEPVRFFYAFAKDSFDGIIYDFDV
ncbi:MAG: cupin domain-containing protein [Paracoccaceae bacterium]